MTLEPSKRRLIEVLLTTNEPLNKTSLSNLTCLCIDDLEYFKQLWSLTPVERRRDIISQLVKLSQENFRLNFSEIFVYCLYDVDSKVRTDAILGLSEEESYRYVAPLLAILKKDTDEKVREVAVKALGNFALQGASGKFSDSIVNRIYDALLAILDDKNMGMNIKCLALEAISPLNLPRVREFIAEAYNSDDINLKISALRAMGRNCDPFWLTDLRESLHAGNNEVRYESAFAIGELGCEEVLADLVKLLDDPDIRIQEAAIRGLGEVGGERPRQVLNDLLKSPQQRIRNAAKIAIKELDFCNDPVNPSL